MSNNKQSSVEWLDRWHRDNPEATHEEGNQALEQAKAMHKKQCVDFAEKTIRIALCEDIQNPFNLDELYNETFGSNQPPTPDPKLIDSMAMRYRHDFGLLTESEKESIRITMKQLWEETAGIGFYKP